MLHACSLVHTLKSCSCETAELGDFDPRQHSPGYVSELRLLPNQTEVFERRVATLHRRLRRVCCQFAQPECTVLQKKLLSTHADRHVVDISVTVCFSVCFSVRRNFGNRYLGLSLIHI